MRPLLGGYDVLGRAAGAAAALYDLTAHSAVSRDGSMA